MIKYQNRLVSKWIVVLRWSVKKLLWELLGNILAMNFYSIFKRIYNFLIIEN